MKRLILVFDLDNTLYEEETYVQSGFKAVANYLKTTYSINFEDCFEFMMNRLQRGRGSIFDETLLHYGIYNKKNVKKCVSIYHTHLPKIFLSEETEECLERFIDIPKYIVTDGNKLVQHNKLVALKLYSRMKFCFVTHRYGIKNSKPSPYCFLKICQKEEVKPPQVVYVGDNPHKDFLGIKSLGFVTVRILQGPYKMIKKPSKYQAEYQIDSLSEITFEFLKTVQTKRR